MKRIIPKERDIQQAIQQAAPLLKCHLMRNNVGLVEHKKGGYVRYGLCVGSSDLIGYTIVNGQAIFTAVEVKRPRQKPTPAQTVFLASVKQAGGIAVVASDFTDLQDAIKQYTSSIP